MVRTHVRTVVRLVVIAAVVCLSSRTEGRGFSLGQPQTQPPRPQFETRAELVLVDVTVVDDDGRPVADLTATDFSIEVNGQTRAVESAQFISVAPSSGEAATPRAARVTTNEGASSGRLLLFAVDEGNLRFGAARTVLRTAEMMLATLAPGDLVGLARLPDGAGGVEFTANRARIRQALQKVTGKVSPTRGRLTTNLRLSEAMARENNLGVEWDQILNRECGEEQGPRRDACAANVEGEAASMVVQTEADARRSIAALEGLLSRLSAFRAPVNIVLITEGLFVGRDRNRLSRMAELAAAARATLHIVQPGQSIFDIDSPGQRGLPMSDDQVLSEGLEILAGQTRGALHKIEAASGAGVFDRLGTELSGYYLLGFAPTDADRTGKERRIRVRAARRGVRVRARPTFVIRDAAAATTTTTPDAALADALMSPLPSPDVPLRVATYNATASTGGKVRVVVAAEIGGPARDPREWPVGVIAVDVNGKIVAQSLSKPSLAPARSTEASPALLLTSLLLDPGEYILRVGAALADGRAGSVHHAFTAKLTALPGSLTASDLLLSSIEPGTGTALRPSPSAIVDSDAASALIEISGADRAAATRTSVTFEIAASDEAPALVTAPSGSERAPGSASRAFTARIPLGLLPPGEYVARALVTVPGHEPARVTQPFVLTASAATTTTAAAATAPRDVDEEAVPPPPSRILAPVPRFAPESALEPGVVRVFLDTLVASRPPSATIAPIVEQARTGTFVMTTADAGTSADDELTLAFIRGLAALQKGSFAEAAGWFQQTLRGASDFLGAAFYLGACHAARGQDREAVGAWQMSLLSDGGAAAYPVLVDALLRLGDGPKAFEFLEEAPDAWPDADSRLRREAIVQAMLGRYPEAVTGLTSLLTRHPDDLDLLFVAIQVLYRRHLESPLSEADQAVFLDYTSRYEKAAGPQIALVDAWRRYVAR
jgi:VWFA-related protein